MDFTLKTYRKLLMALKNAGYKFLTFEEWCESKIDDKIVILRHDIDLKADRSLAIARIEKEYGIKSSFYFRAGKSKKQTNCIKQIVALGHEIGYHYHELSTFKGDYIKSIEYFKNQLAYFRQFYPVRTICMHGSPASKYDNRDLWKQYNYNDFGIVGEPYFDFLAQPQAVYFTDTARMWDGEKYNVRDKAIGERVIQTEENHTPLIHSTTDLIGWIETSAATPIMITSHPQRWTENAVEWLLEFIFQSLKNRLKRLLIIFR